jgi:tryptophan synthase alpha chain
MNRIQHTFNELKRKGGKAIIPYIMAGDGGMDCLIDRLLILEEMGATAIEVGIPFSDPVADGPTIQKAGNRALENGTSLRTTIDELARARKAISVPILLMTYLNPIYSYGIEKFVQEIVKAGVDACIIPDLPIEEEEIICPLLSEVNIELIRLVTMTTPLDRIKMIAHKGRGFLYTVTVKGITGTRNELDHEVGQFLKIVKEISPIPVLAGFGISNERQIEELASYCDGVIVGSKIVELFNKNDLESLKRLLSVFNLDKNVQ